MIAIIIVYAAVGALLAYVYRTMTRSSASRRDAHMDTPQPGDLLFYRSTGAWYERLIVAATCDGNPRADYVHVALVESDSTIIEARWQGVTRSPLPDVANNPRIVGYRLPIHSPEALQQALDGARGQVGWKYGKWDIVSQFLRLLRLPFFVGRLHSLDCSHLAAEFAAWATEDARLYALVCDEGCDVSPNSLATYYGLTKAATYAEVTT